MTDLSDRIALLGLPTLEGEGVGTGGDWPSEPSLLVLGIGGSEAVELGRAFGQVAIVIGRLGAPARLSFCSPPPDALGRKQLSESGPEASGSRVGRIAVAAGGRIRYRPAPRSLPESRFPRTNR